VFTGPKKTHIGWEKVLLKSNCVNEKVCSISLLEERTPIIQASVDVGALLLLIGHRTTKHSNGVPTPHPTSSSFEKVIAKVMLT
jgi:hypothetical protein